MSYLHSECLVAFRELLGSRVAMLTQLLQTRFGGFRIVRHAVTQLRIDSLNVDNARSDIINYAAKKATKTGIHSPPTW